MLTFLSPWWAAGAFAAIGLPLLAHLLSRSRYREVLFPATRFVKQAVEQTTRIEKPRHRLLMLLRWLLLLMVVLAFMRPRWLPEAGAHRAERGVALVVLLDASASMQRIESGATLYERAVRESNGLLDELDATRDAASVIHVARHAEPLLPEPTANLSLLRDALSRSGPTYESANWAGAVAQVQRLIEASDRPVRVVVISDQQGDGPVFDGEAASLGVPVRYVRIDGAGGNAAVRLVDVSPYPPTANQPVTARVQVSHDGTEARDIVLRATLGGAQSQRSIRLAPGGRQLVELSLRAPPREGVSLLQLSIDNSDPMDFDDTAGLPMRINRQTQALVLHGPSPDGAQLAKRVAAMLRPDAAEGLLLPRVGVLSDEDGVDAVRDADPAMLRTVVVLDPKRIDDALAEQLDAYAKRGGGVVVFVPDLREALANQVLPIPFVLTANRRYLVVDRPASQIDFSLEPLRVFEGPARTGLASLVWPGIDPVNAQADSQTLLADEHNRPIVVATALGRGRLIALNTDLSPGPGGLLAEPAFVVLFNELCRYASPGPPIPAPARPGDALPISLRNNDKLGLPDGAQPDTAIITRPGAYVALDRSGNISDGVWAALDPAESDTRTSKGWADRDGNGNTIDRDPNEPRVSGGAVIGRPESIELWPYAVLGALMLAAGESLALWRFAGQRGVRA